MSHAALTGPHTKPAVLPSVRPRGFLGRWAPWGPAQEPHPLPEDSSRPARPEPRKERIHTVRVPWACARPASVTSEKPGLI